jgi:predicted DNA-binding transcriptional regulator AlpA
METSMTTSVHTETVSAPAPDRLLTFAEARQVVGISKSQIYILLEKAAFP